MAGGGEDGDVEAGIADGVDAGLEVGRKELKVEGVTAAVVLERGEVGIESEKDGFEAVGIEVGKARQDGAGGGMIAEIGRDHADPQTAAIAWEKERLGVNLVAGEQAAQDATAQGGVADVLGGGGAGEGDGGAGELPGVGGGADGGRAGVAIEPAGKLGAVVGEVTGERVGLAGAEE